MDSERLDAIERVAMLRSGAGWASVSGETVVALVEAVRGERVRASQLADAQRRALKTRHDELTREAEATGSRSKARHLRERAAGIGDAIFIIAAAGVVSSTQPEATK